MKPLVIFILCLSLSGCGLFKRVTTERTVIITQIDTVLHINIDGYKPIIDSKPLTDTAKVETNTGTSIAYVDPILSKIVLTFMPKTFDVPIIINQKKKEYVKTSEPMTKLIVKVSLIFAGMFLLFGFYVLYRIGKLFKLK